MKFGRAPTTKQILFGTGQGCPKRRLAPLSPYDVCVSDVKTRVRDYWDVRPCGEQLTQAARGSREYFAEIEEAKDRLEPYERDFADFPAWRGREVLEVGCGLGTDTVRFARAGARITAVDITPTAVSLTAQRLADEGLDGAVQQADAEQLPFPDGAFELVYSWGVLHHTPDTAAAVREVARVLRPGGEARVMLYNRRSLFALGVWLLRGAPKRRSLADALATVESPGTKGYTRGELERLFAPFARVQVETIATAYDRRVAGPLAGFAPLLGWNHLVRATV
jgi:ubiquinone/menaquinone biosynthesis C-methylase UbiE